MGDRGLILFSCICCERSGSRGAQTPQWWAARDSASLGSGVFANVCCSLTGQRSAFYMVLMEPFLRRQMWRPWCLTKEVLVGVWGQSILLFSRDVLSDVSSEICRVDTQFPQHHWWHSFPQHMALASLSSIRWLKSLVAMFGSWLFPTGPHVWFCAASTLSLLPRLHHISKIWNGNLSRTALFAQDCSMSPSS